MQKLPRQAKRILELDAECLHAEDLGFVMPAEDRVDAVLEGIREMRVARLAGDEALDARRCRLPDKAGRAAADDADRADHAFTAAVNQADLASNLLYAVREVLQAHWHGQCALEAEAQPAIIAERRKVFK